MRREEDKMILTSQRDRGNGELNRFEELEHFAKTQFKDEYITFESDKIKGFRVTIFNIIGGTIKEDNYKNRREFEKISYANISRLLNPHKIK